MNPLSWLWRMKKKPELVAVKSEDGPNSAIPQGFYNVITCSGQPAGLGFNCYHCRYQIRHSAPQRINHCGRMEVFDPQANLQTVKLNNPTLPPAIAGRTFIDPDANAWNGDVEYTGSGVHTTDMAAWDGAFGDPHSSSFGRGGK